MTNDILALLVTERDRLNRAIEALQGARRRGRPPKWLADAQPKRRGRPPKNVAATATVTADPRTGRKRMSAAARKAHSERMKKFWAERRRKEKG